MARGKQITPELICKVMASYAVTQNKSETARLLCMGESTVRKIIKENENNVEYANLCEQKRKEFAEASSEIIDKILCRITKLIDSGADIPLNQLTTALGTLYDKRALARGESTENQSVTVKLPEGAEKYAG